jgi:hypothetical protein
MALTNFLTKYKDRLKCFRLSVTLSFKKAGRWYRVSLDESAQADQGSEINVISRQLVEGLGMTTFPLTEVGFGSLHMLTSDGRHTLVTDFVAVKVLCEGITREIWAVVRPGPYTNNDNKLLLGLPWLWDVNAYFDIRQSSLRIGDTSRGERSVTISGPLLSPMSAHRLTLGPEGVALDLDQREGDSASDTNESDEDEESSSEYFSGAESEAESGN